MKGRIRINNHNNGYLIHGQPFNIQYEFDEAKWVLVVFRLGVMSSNMNKARKFIPGSRFFIPHLRKLRNWKILKSKGELSHISNAYYPSISFYLFSSIINIKPQKFVLPLQINFINSREIDMKTRESLNLDSPQSWSSKSLDLVGFENFSFKTDIMNKTKSDFNIELIDIEFPNLKPIHN